MGGGGKQSNSGCRGPCHIVQAELHGHAGWAKKKLDERERKEEDTSCKRGISSNSWEGYEYGKESDLGQIESAK